MKAQHKTYLWQRTDWPHLSWDAERLIEPLARLSHLHGALTGRMSMLGLDMKNKSMVGALAEELLGTSEIEGVVLDPHSVRSSIARRLGIEDDGLLAEDHYVEGLVDVMLDAIRNNNAPLTADRLFDWHAALFPTGRSGMYKITVSEWRKGEEPMQVVSGAFGREKVHFEAPPSSRVAEEMTRFFEWFNNTDISPFTKSALAHLWFVTIHPFDDGNGRISRTITDMALSRLEQGTMRYYSMSAEINRNKKHYYNALERAQQGGLDVTDWILWFFATLENAITRAMQTVERTIRKAEYWDANRNFEVNERQRKIINMMWDGFDGKLTTSKWAKICRCSQDTALRDINDLLAKGMLRDSGEKGRNTNYLLP